MTDEKTKPRLNAQGDELETLNFKVPRDFKWAYKAYAATNQISMLQLLREGFELSQKKRQAAYKRQEQ